MSMKKRRDSAAATLLSPSEKILAQEEKEQGKARRKKRRIFKILCFSLAGLLVALVLADFLAAAVTVHRWTHPKKVTWDLYDTPAAEGLDYYDFTVETENGRVSGWKMAAQDPIDMEEAEDWVSVTEYSDRTVILIPNYDSNRQLLQDVGGMDYYADWCAAGYNVIAFDWTGSGYSDGTKNVFTLDKVEELQAVVDYAAKETGASQIVLQSFGFSCYPAAVVAARSEAVDALILDSSYETFSQAFWDRMDAWTWLDFFPVENTIRWLFPVLSGVDAKSVSLMTPITELSGKSVFFIQGGADEQFGVEGTQRLYEAALKDNNASLWIPSGVLHLRARSYDQEEYINRILAFLEKSFETEQEI